MPEKAKWTRKGLKATLALMEANRAEDARRLARYDEAIRLLLGYESCVGYAEDAELAGKVRAFLAAEPKEGRG